MQLKHGGNIPHRCSFPFRMAPAKDRTEGQRTKMPSFTQSFTRQTLSLLTRSRYAEEEKKARYLSVKNAPLPSLARSVCGRPEMVGEIPYRLGVMRFGFNPDTQNRLLITFNPLFTELGPASSFKLLGQTLGYAMHDNESFIKTVSLTLCKIPFDNTCAFKITCF